MQICKMFPVSYDQTRHSIECLYERLKDLRKQMNLNKHSIMTVVEIVEVDKDNNIIGTMGVCPESKVEEVLNMYGGPHTVRAINTLALSDGHRFYILRDVSEGFRMIDEHDMEELGRQALLRGYAKRHGLDDLDLRELGEILGWDGDDLNRWGVNYKVPVQGSVEEVKNE